MQNKLSQNVIFVKSYTPYDFSKRMHQLAVEITYTSGETDMLTTPIPKEYGNDPGNFKNETEFYAFISWLDSQGVKRN